MSHQIGSALCNSYNDSDRMSCYLGWEDGCVYDTQAVDTVDAQLGIDNARDRI